MDDPNAHTGDQKPQTRLSAAEITLIVLATLVCALVLRMFVLEAFRIPSASMENTLLTGDMILVNKVSYGVRLPSSFPFLPVRLEPRYLVSLSNIRRGDVIVFELPGLQIAGEPGEQSAFVKRCIGVPGDTVELHYSRILVNGRELLPPGTVRTPSFQRASVLDELYPRGAGFSVMEYGPLYVPGAGDEIPLDERTLPAWERVIEREGHRIDRTNGSILIDGVAADSYTLAKNYYFVLGDNLDNSSDSRMWGFVCEDDIVGEAILVYWSSAPINGYTGETRTFRNIRWDRIGSMIL